MKLTITHLDSGIKKKTSKGASPLSYEIVALEKIFTIFLSKNPHFKGVKAVAMTLTICGKTKIRSLNRQYREMDKATDVLSFGIYENLRPDRIVKVANLPQMDLGDIFICKEIASSQAKSFSIEYNVEIIHLCVHGFLHLLGFDHEVSVNEEKIMQQYESTLVDKILKKLKALK